MNTIKDFLHYVLIVLAFFGGFYAFDYFGLPRSAESNPFAWLGLFVGYLVILILVDKALHKLLNLD